MSSPGQDRPLLAIAFMLVAVTCLSAVDAIGKAAIEFLPSVQILFLRSVCILAVMVPTQLRGREIALRTSVPWLHAANVAAWLVTMVAFVGYYAINTQTRPAYCKKLGVDIGPYVAAFDAANAVPLARARANYASRPAGAEEAVVQAIRPKLEQMIRVDMTQVAALAQGSQEEGCEYLAKNADAIVAQLRFEASQPDAYRELLAP